MAFFSLSDRIIDNNAKPWGYSIPVPAEGKTKELSVTSVTGTPTINRAVCLKITSGDESTTGIGEIVLDWTDINSKSDIAVYDENDNLLDYYFEYFDATAEEAIIWVHKSWVRDGSVQAKIAYGNGSSDKSVGASTVFSKETDMEAGYLFNETSGDLLDISGSEHNGTIHGGITRGQEGVTSKAYTFDGVDGYVEVADHDSLTFVDGAGDLPFSYSLWIKLDDTNACGIFSKAKAAGSGEYYLFMGSDRSLVAALVDHSSSAWDRKQTSGGVVATDDWIHVFVTYHGSGNANGLTVYVNGAEESVADSDNGTYNGMENTEVSLRIGERGGSNFPGSIADIRLYSSTITEADVNAFYAATKNSPDFFSQLAGA